jgi:hypothetical protein
MTTLPPFRLSVAPYTVCTIKTTTGLGAPPRELCLDLGIIVNRAREGDSEVQVQNESVADAHNDPVIEETPATSKRRGSFNYDRGMGGYGMEWSNIDEFDAWHRSEELANSIELIASSTVHGGTLWTRKRIYVCSRQRSGGPSKYQKKHPERHRKLESKKTGCRCRVVIKQYPHTETILGRYTNKHDHEIGEANAAYTRLSRSRNAREQIKTKLMQQSVGIQLKPFFHVL